MKKTLLLLAVTTAMLSCKNEPQIDYALLTGTIENPAGKTITIRNSSFNQSINLNDDGSFADTLRITSGYYTFNHGRENTTLYLDPGNTLNISVDTKEFDETINYSGIGSENNNYLASKALNIEKLQGDGAVFYSLDESEFKQKLVEIEKSNLEALNTSEQINTDFKTIETKNLQYDYLASFSSYEPAHAYYAKKKGFKVSDDFLPEAFKNMSFDNVQDYQFFQGYRSIAMGKTSNTIYENIGEDYQSVTLDHLAPLLEVNIEALKNDIIKSMGSFLISPANPNMEALYNFFISNSTDDEFKTKLTAKFNKNKDLTPGKPSPVFSNYENHKGGETSLEDLKGKYVYVDVWATWCGPCKREIPFLKEVEKSYHGKNIAFVSTSIDKAKDHDAWVAMVKDKALGGIQLFADSDWQSKFVTDYAIEGIPRFILIGPDGNIVSADAPRPSNPKLVELFKELKI